jgi:hypothetical protein
MAYFYHKQPKVNVGKKMAWVLLIAFVVMQFIRPHQNESTADHLADFLLETNPPGQVQEILENSCFDCHSNHTRYPWYNGIAPVSYWLADHIQHGQEHLNFSEWSGYDDKKKDHKLEEVVETVKSGEMPLREYTWTHREARLTNAQRTAVVEWAERTRALYALGDRPK